MRRARRHARGCRCAPPGALLAAVAGLALLPACGDGTGPEPAATTAPSYGPAGGRIEAGLEALQDGHMRPARAMFWEVIRNGGLDPSSCHAHYGYALAIMFEFVGALADSSDFDGVDNGNRIGLGDLNPLAPGASGDGFRAAATATTEPTPEIDAFVTSLLDPARKELILPAIEGLTVAAREGCVVEVPRGIPLITAATTTVRIGTRFGEPEALLALGALEAVAGALDLIIAHDLRIDFATGLTILNDILDAASLDDPLLLRGLGGAIGRSPTFLELHPERGDAIAGVGPQIRAGIGHLRAGLEALFYGHTGPARADAVLGYVDATGDGRVNYGDELHIGVIEADPMLELLGARIGQLPISVTEGVPGILAEPVLFRYVGDSFLDDVDHLLGRVDANIAGRGPLLNPAEFNRLLPLPLIPSAFALDLSRLLPSDRADALPLRRMLPAWGDFDPPGGDDQPFGATYTTFLVEAEVEPGAHRDRLEQEVDGNDLDRFCYQCSPGPRFRNHLYGVAGRFRMAAEVESRLGVTVATELPDDCVAPGNNRTLWTYFWWQDPTFNGALFVNLDALPGPACANDAATGSVGPDPGGDPVHRRDAVPGNRYSVNKALNKVLGGLPSTVDLF